MNPYERGVTTWVGDADKLVESQSCLVWWLVISPKTSGTAGRLIIRDGFSSSGKEVFRIRTAYARCCPLPAPLRLATGLFIDVDDNIDSYTVGYLTEEMLRGK